MNKVYTYSINKYGYRIFCNGECIIIAETDRKRGKRFSKTNCNDFTNAALAQIKYFEAMDKYYNSKKDS